MKKENIKKYALIFLLITILIVIDQVSKIIVLNKFKTETGTDTEKNGIINLTKYVEEEKFEEENKELEWIMENRIREILTEAIVIAMIARFLIVQVNNMYLGTKISLLLILSGGISNLIDRIVRGRIVSFIDLTGQMEKFPTFNFSHVLILIGFIIFAISVFIYILSLRKPVSKILEKESKIVKES